MGNSISNHPKKLSWLILGVPFFHLGMVGQNAKFQSNALLDLWSIKDNPCRPVPGGQKLHFFLAVFHKSYNILKTLCHMSLKI